METNIKCSSCDSKLIIKKRKNGKIIGTITGGGIGYGVASTLGIAGTVVGVAVALPATVVGIVFFGLIGNRLGNDADRKKLKCSKCNMLLKI